MLREIAENPNVYQSFSAGRELLTDPAGRWSIYLRPGTDPHCATVQRVRLDGPDVADAVAGIRALLRALGREGAEWELGESCTPADLIPRLEALGVRRDEDEPVAMGMVLRGPLSSGPPPGVSARRVRSIDELEAARLVQYEAFGLHGLEEDPALLRADFEHEGIGGSTFVALADGEIVGAAYASYTPHALILFGGATLPGARGRGAYRALVAARAEEAAARGTPVLVTHAGQMSRPILERLGFEALARIDRLLDQW